MKAKIRIKIFLAIILFILTSILAVLMWLHRDTFLALIDPTYNYQEPYNMLLRENNVQLMESQQYQINPIKMGHACGSAKVKYQSSDEEIATVSKDGMLQALKPGYVEITLTSRKIVRVMKFTIYEKPQQLNLFEQETTLRVGSSYQIDYEVLPEESFQPVSFIIGDEELIRVNEQGIIKALKEGNTTVQIETGNGLSQTVYVEVESEAAKLSFDTSSLVILLGKNNTQKVKVGNPEEAGAITYTSTNPKVARVNENGKVSALSVGKTTIWATSASGLRCSYKVEVKISDIQIPVTRAPMMLGRIFQCNTSFQSINADAVVLYKSDDEKVASVTDKGLIRANGYGNTIITAYSSDGKDKVEIRVEVSDRFVANGIDVSKWQGSISADSWVKVKQQGIDFAYIRIAYSTLKKGYRDQYFAANYRNAKAAGLDVGIYHYVMCTDEESAVEEAASLLYHLSRGDYQFEYPIMMDFEHSSQTSLPADTQMAIIKTYCDIIREAGYDVVVYSFSNNLRKLDKEFLKQYGPKGTDLAGVAVAQWSTLNPNLHYKGTFTLWQYTSDGKVDGLRGRIDMDLAVFDYPTYMKENHLNGY
ncbi:MAG: Ig-like domain-containing protein [Erysipelotrichaceae bacterium]|nr:Ig-like domain-containing protein [Erysipelotrichaceae bacterium]